MWLQSEAGDENSGSQDRSSGQLLAGSAVECGVTPNSSVRDAGACRYQRQGECTGFSQGTAVETLPMDPSVSSYSGVLPVSSRVASSRPGRGDPTSRQSLVPVVVASSGRVGAAEARRVSWHEGVEDTLPSAIRRQLLQQAAPDDEIDCKDVHDEPRMKRRFWSAQPAQQQTAVYRPSRREGGGTKRTGRHKQRRWVSHQLLVAALRRCMYESGEDLTDTDGGGGVSEPAKPSCWQLLQMNAVVCEAFRKRREDALFRGSAQGSDSRDTRGARRAEQERRRYHQALRQNRTQQQQLLCLMQQRTSGLDCGAHVQMETADRNKALQFSQHTGQTSLGSDEKETERCAVISENGEAIGCEAPHPTVPVCRVNSFEEQRALLLHLRNQEKHLLQKLQHDEVRSEKVNPSHGSGQLRPSGQLLRAIRSSFRGVRALVAGSLYLQTFLKAMELRILACWVSLRWIEATEGPRGFVDNGCTTPTRANSSHQKAETQACRSREDDVVDEAVMKESGLGFSREDSGKRERLGEATGEKNESKWVKEKRLFCPSNDESEVLPSTTVGRGTTAGATVCHEGAGNAALGGNAEHSVVEREEKIQAELLCGKPVVIVRADHAFREGGSPTGVKEALDGLRLGQVSELSASERNTLKNFFERRRDRFFEGSDRGNNQTACDETDKKPGASDPQSDVPALSNTTGGVLVVLGLDGLQRKLTHGLIALLDDLHAFSIPVKTLREGRGTSSNGRVVAEYGRDTRGPANTIGVSEKGGMVRGGGLTGKSRKGPRRQGTDEKALIITRRTGVQRGSCLSGRPMFSPADELLKAIGIVRPQWTPR